MTILRTLVSLCALIVFAALEFFIWPGHTYLEGASQLFVPMLERLRTPGLLSRDLVATHPILRYTIYDEVTLLLESVRLPMQQALAVQQVLGRLAGLAGLYLLARSAGSQRAIAVVVAAVCGLGFLSPGISVSTADREPLPYAIAFGFALLATGLAANGKILLCSLVAGTSLLYSPAISAPLWLILLAGCLIVRRLRIALRALLTGFIVFVLLLANLAQLQPGASNAVGWFGRASPEWLAVLRERTPSTLVASWAGHEFWLYLAIWSAGACALLRLWPKLNVAARWLLGAFPMAGLLAIPSAAAAQYFFPIPLFLQTEPARALLFTVALSLLLFGSAAAESFRRRRPLETAVWLAGFAALGVVTPIVQHRGLDRRAQPRELASWAERNTWGGSMFLFADAGRTLIPGAFRALSLRPVYVDWQSGELAPYYDDFSAEWHARWQQVNSLHSSAEDFGRLLDMPIDYYVLRKPHCLPRVAAAFETRDLCVYDARDLRDARLRVGNLLTR